MHHAPRLTSLHTRFTSFPLLLPILLSPIMLLSPVLQPPIGSGIVFYSYGPGWDGRQCNPGSRHRSNPVTRGTKVVAQRWHSCAARRLPTPALPTHALAFPRKPR